MRMVLRLFTLFVYLSWPRKKKKDFLPITATSLVEDIGHSFYPQLPEKETEVPGKLLPSQSCSLLSKASFALLQCPEMAMKS